MNYLSSQEILYIHNRVVDEIKGKHGARDINILKKAISYIQDNGVFPDIFSKAGALFFAIAKKKPFNDLNTQTALATTKTLLKLNKYDLDIKNLEKFIKNNLSSAKVKDITEWLKKNSKPLKKK